MAQSASGGAASMFAAAQVGVMEGNYFYNIQGNAVFNQGPGSNPVPTIEDTIAKLEGLAGASRALEFVKIHDEIIHFKTEGTGASFRAKGEVQKWETGEIRVLWIRGGPGAGKTYMASSFIEWSKELAAKEPPGTAAVVYAYMRYDQKLTEYCVVLAVLVQLIWSSQHLPNVLLKVHEVLAERSRSKSRPPLNKLVGLVKDIVQEFRSVRLIFDGMDEMLRDLQYLLVQIFVDIPAQIVFLSRPSELLESATREEFESSSIAFIDLVAGEEDLDIFITTSINRVLPLRRVLLKHGKMGYVVLTVRVQAKGMFLHAALQVERLKTCHTIRSVNQALEEFPAKIEDLYLNTLRRVYDQEDSSFAELILMWLLHIRGNMTLDDLRYAVAVSAETYEIDEDNLLDEGDVLSMCCGLVVVEATTQQVRFIHYSAYQVLLELMQRNFLSNPTSGNHESIAQTCLARLGGCGFKDTEFETLGDLRDAFETHPLLEYAYRNTSYHIRQAIATSSSIRTAVELFVRTCRSFPYYPNPEPHDSDSNELCQLASLHLAAFFGVCDLVSDLINVHGAHVDLQSVQPPSLGWTALMIAAVEGHEDVLELLLSLGANVNTINQWGHNALLEPAYNKTRSSYLKPLQPDPLRYQVP